MHEAIAHHLAGQCGAGGGIGSGVRDLALGQPAAFVADGGLEGRRAGMAAHAADLDPVGPVLVEFGLADVGRHVGREIGGRVVHFVEQLLGDGAPVHATAGAGGLGDHEAAVRMHLDDGKTRLGQARHVLHARIREVAAGDLRAALQQVAGHGAGGQQVPGVGGPVEVGQDGAQRQGRVRDAPGHDDLGAGAQRAGDLLRAEVRIGAHERLSGEPRRQQLSQRSRRQRREQVVAFDHRDAQGAQPESGGQGVETASRARGIGRAEVADDGDPGGHAARQHRLQEALERRLPAGVRLLAPLQLGQRQRAFGQRLVHQHRGPAQCRQRLHHRHGGIPAVAGKARAAADAQDGRG